MTAWARAQSPSPSRMAWLFRRLLFVLVLVDLAGAGVFWAFAPRWLLLDDPLVAHVASTARVVGLLLFACELAVLGGLLLYNRRALGPDSQAPPEPPDLLRLFGLPARLAYARVAIAAIFDVITLFDFARPEGLDTYTQGALALLHLTLVIIATLPLYVASRAAVGRTLEQVPIAVSREAVALLVQLGRNQRVRRRFLFALATPVALVSVGATLLVYAHANNAAAVASRADAMGFASGVLDLVEGQEAGRVAAMTAARSFGLNVEIDRAQGVQATPAGASTVVVALEDGSAVVRYQPSGPGPATLVWLAAALLAIVSAALLGQRLGARLSADVTLATREIEAMGVVDVLRGSRVYRQAYFQSVQRLASAVDELGGVFREFAAAQERAIVARAGAERMRALLLATMSHDLKGPLNAILGFAALLERGVLTDGQRENLVIIQQRGRELLFLIQTVLEAARLEAGPLDLVRHEAPALDIVMAAALDARELLAGSGRDVIVGAASELPVLEVDSARLVEALVCVVHAVSRMSERGPIRVRAAPTPSRALRVSVEADALVLAPEERARIAGSLESDVPPEPDATANVRVAGRRPMSLALGLSIARAVLESHGGSLSIDAAEAGAPLRLVATVPSADASMTVKTAPPKM